jgi:hypothetical protein
MNPINAPQINDIPISIVALSYNFSRLGVWLNYLSRYLTITSVFASVVHTLVVQKNIVVNARWLLVVPTTCADIALCAV